jgi:hypothetical protein
MNRTRTNRRTGPGGPFGGSEGAAPISRRGRPPSLFVAAALASLLMAGPALTQEDGAESLAERSAIVVLGKVLKTSASDEPLVAASESTAVISVQRMYAGSEIAGDLTGRTATVILSRPGRLKAGEQALFFGNPRFLGRTLTIADEGEILSTAAAAGPALQRGLQARRDKPVVERLATASLVFRGTVETVRPLEEVRPPEAAAEQGKRYPARPSEHDPEWQVASVKVVTPLLGAEAGQVVTVLFPGSRDIVWYHAPKLKPGQEAVFITHALTKEDAAASKASGLPAFLERQPAHAVTEPFDVLPPSDEARVRALLSGAKGVK